MKQVTINLYEFSELSEKAKKRAIEELSDLNIDHDWHQFTCEDAETIGLKITGFDIYRKNITGEFILSACEVAQNIFNNHGETCETYKTAQNFMDEWQPIYNNYMDEKHENYESRESEEEMQKLEDDFLSSLLEDYFVMLESDYEYRTSEEAIIESIESNEYTFEENGTMRNF